jgi:hypothetical protein
LEFQEALNRNGILSKARDYLKDSPDSKSDDFLLELIKKTQELIHLALKIPTQTAPSGDTPPDSSPQGMSRSCKL